MIPLPAAPNRRARIRVVIADDDELYAETIGVFLGYDDRIEVVGYARDGYEAVSLAVSVCPDVVVMDLHMPRLDGVEATRRLRAGELPVRVIILSASGAGEDVERAREAGAAAYVTKQRAADELVAEISRHAGAASSDDLRACMRRGPYARPALCRAA